MSELLKSMIGWKAHHCRTVKASVIIIAIGDPTVLIFCIESCVATDGGGRSYGDGEPIGLCEALTFDSYSTPLSATSTSRLACIWCQ